MTIVELAFEPWDTERHLAALFGALDEEGRRRFLERVADDVGAMFP